MSAAETIPTAEAPIEEGGTRRDFLSLVTGFGAAIGVGAVAWSFISFMSPAADVLAAGEPIDVDVSKLAPGQQVTVVWRGKPIFVMRRTPEALKTLQDASLLNILSDPNSKRHQQPPYADNWHRSIKPEIAVLVGICTHLGCVPLFFPNKSDTEPVPGWPGGYFCPCHGSKYDLAGRVYAGVPAPLNLPVPPYKHTSDSIARVGENPPGQTFDLNSVEQI